MDQPKQSFQKLRLILQEPQMMDRNWLHPYVLIGARIGDWLDINDLITIGQIA